MTEICQNCKSDQPLACVLGWEISVCTICIHDARNLGFLKIPCELRCTLCKDRFIIKGKHFCVECQCEMECGNDKLCFEHRCKICQIPGPSYCENHKCPAKGCCNEDKKCYIHFCPISTYNRFFENGNKCFAHYCKNCKDNTTPNQEEYCQSCECLDPDCHKLHSKCDKLCRWCKSMHTPCKKCTCVVCHEPSVDRGKVAPKYALCETHNKCTVDDCDHIITASNVRYCGKHEQNIITSILCLRFIDSNSSGNRFYIMGKDIHKIIVKYYQRKLVNWKKCCKECGWNITHNVICKYCSEMYTFVIYKNGFPMELNEENDHIKRFLFFNK